MRTSEGGERLVQHSRPLLPGSQLPAVTFAKGTDGRIVRVIEEQPPMRFEKLPCFFVAAASSPILEALGYDVR